MLFLSGNSAYKHNYKLYIAYAKYFKILVSKTIKDSIFRLSEDLLDFSHLQSLTLRETQQFLDK